MLNSSRDENEGAHRINSRGGVPAIYGTLLLILRSIRLKLRKGGSRRIGAETNIGSGKKTGKTNEYLVRVEIVNKIDAVSVSDRTRLRFDIYSYNPSLLAMPSETAPWYIGSSRRPHVPFSPTWTGYRAHDERMTTN